jgi:phosphoribosylformylglycinamidine (FGAM) synthase-like enzyme
MSRPSAASASYHKPIMIAGGVGTIDAELTHKILFPAGTLPDSARRPGQYRHGGSAATDGVGRTRRLDFDSVQRGNPEIDGARSHQPVRPARPGKPDSAIRHRRGRLVQTPSRNW